MRALYPEHQTIPDPQSISAEQKADIRAHLRGVVNVVRPRNIISHLLSSIIFISGGLLMWGGMAALLFYIISEAARRFNLNGGIVSTVGQFLVLGGLYASGAVLNSVRTRWMIRWMYGQLLRHGQIIPGTAISIETVSDNMLSGVSHLQYTVVNPQDTMLTLKYVTHQHPVYIRQGDTIPVLYYSDQLSIVL